MTVKMEPGSSLPELVEVMRRLLAPDGCPWDREQSFATLRKYVLEEASEVAEAGDALGADGEHPRGPARELGPEDPRVANLREELGDLLLQVVFQAELARSRGWFGTDEVVHGIATKMRQRHPHVFGDAKVSGSAEVLVNWEAQKARERAGRGRLEGVPKGMPALARAARLGEKAATVGFDWPDAEGPRQKVTEELAELDEALASGDASAVESELGDVLFSLVNLARRRGVDPERALAKTCDRFTARFRHVEKSVTESGRGWDGHDAAALDVLWREAKAREGQQGPR